MQRTAYRRPIVGSVLMLGSLGLACGDGAVTEDLPPGGFTSEAAIDTFGDLGLDESSDGVAADVAGDDDADVTDGGMVDTGPADSSGSSTGEPCEEIPAGLSHAADIVPLWESACTVAAACHVPGGQFPDLQTDALTALGGESPLAGAPYLTASDADNSYVWLKIAGRQAEVGGPGGSMPVAPGELTVCEELIIEAWIAQGAAP